MVIYLLCFGVSILFAYFASRTKRRADFIILSLFSISVTVILAGLRDISIGIDTKNYYEGYWAWGVRSTSLSNFVKSYLERGSLLEFLYVLFVGLIAQTTGNFQVYLLLVHAIIIGCIYIGAFRLRNHVNPLFTLLMFYLLYYNHSLNISRQYMAMSIIFAGVADLEQRRFFHYLLFVCIAFLIHNTAIIGTGPLLFYLVLYSNMKTDNASRFRKIMLIALISVLYIGFIPLIRFVLGSGFFGSHYDSYVLMEEERIPLTVVLLLIAESVLLVLFWIRIKHIKQYLRFKSETDLLMYTQQHAEFFLFCSIMFLVLYRLAPLIFYGKRVAAYFSFLNIVTLGMAGKLFRDRKIGIAINGATIAAALVYWLYFYGHLNASLTIPYLLAHH